MKIHAYVLPVVLTLPGAALAAETTQAMEEVVVTAAGSQVELLDPFAGDQVARGGRAGLLGNMDMMDLPFTGTAYTQSLIQNQQARTIGDVLQNDPVVRVAKGFGNFQEVYVIRGFPVFSDDMTFNGLYGILPRQTLSPELVERVEVFRGANSFLNGAAPGGSGVGGVFNVVPKRAGAEPLSRLTLGFESDAQFYGAIDAGRRFGAADEFGVRINVVGREGEMGIEDQDRSLKVVSVGTDYQGERLRLYADFGYQDHHLDNPRPQVTPLGAAPRAPDAADNYAQPWTFSDEKQLFGAARGEFDLADNVTLWLAFGGRYGEEENRLANPNSAVTGVTSSSRFDNTREDTVYSADGGVRVEFATGPIEHRVIVSASGLRSDSDNAFEFYLTSFANNLYVPTAAALPTTGVFAGGVLSDPLRTEAVRNWGVAIADVMSLFDGRVLATVGVRRQSIETRTFDFNSGAPLSAYDDHAVTPVGGLVVRPFKWLSLFANYAESLQPGDIAPSQSGGTPIINAGEALDPFRGEQIEFGLKLDRESYGATIAVFELNQPNSIVDNGRFTSSGEQQTRGVELSVFGEPLTGVRLLGGVTFLDAELAQTAGGVDEGNTPVGIPDTQLNFNLEWDLPMVPGLTVDGRVTYTDKQYINTANTFSIPDWHRFDLGARYTTRVDGRPLVIRGRVENVGDKDYWASAGGFPGANYLVQGAPRTFIVSMSMDF